MIITLAQINVIIGDLENNFQKIIEYVNKANASGADLLVFPELALTGYPMEDLAQNNYFLSKVKNYFELLISNSKNHKLGIVLSIPEKKEDKIYNVGYFIHEGRILGSFIKTHLPNYGVFDEPRVFSPSYLHPQTIQFSNKRLGFLICEDMWFDDIADELNKQQADLFVVLNASPFDLDKQSKRYELASKLSIKHSTPLIYINHYGGQDELVFDGGSFIIDDKGKYILSPQHWEEKLIISNLNDIQVKSDERTIGNQNRYNKKENIYQALMTGLRDYLVKNHFKKVILGLSGGIDSAFVALLAADVMGSDNVNCVMLPTKYTSQESLKDAAQFSENLGIILQEININNIFSNCIDELQSILPSLQDLTQQNLQSRIRALLLMAISNNTNAILLSTTNKSESATGYGTLYGDIAGGFAPIKDVYKNELYKLADWRNSNIPLNSKCAKLNIIPHNIFIKAPTAELRNDQTDQDTLPPYEVLDPILYQLIEMDKNPNELMDMNCSPDTIVEIYLMLKKAEYKRKQAPMGSKISIRNLSKDRRMPNTYKTN